MAEYFGMATHSVPFPSWMTMAYQIAMFFVFEELSNLLHHTLFRDISHDLFLEPISILMSLLFLVAFITGHIEPYTMANSTRRSTSFITSSRPRLAWQLNMLTPWKSWSLVPVPLVVPYCGVWSRRETYISWPCIFGSCSGYFVRHPSRTEPMDLSRRWRWWVCTLTIM